MTQYTNTFDIKVFYENLKIAIETSNLTHPIPPSVQINLLNTPNYIIGVNFYAFTISLNGALTVGGNSGDRIITPQLYDDLNCYLANNKIVLRNRIALKPMIIENYLRDFNIYKIPIYYEDCIFLRKKLLKDAYRDYCENCTFV